MLVKGASGHVGKQVVYRQRGNDTLITSMPRVRKNAVATDDQITVREKFAAAARYATGAISDPILKKDYQKKAGPSNTAYNIAFRDYLKAPVVNDIDAEKYDGTIGSTISISAKDDFKVDTVKVQLTAPGGSLLEEGNAVQHQTDRNKWTYTATTANALVAGTIITAVAKDIPGNKGSLEVTL